MGTIRIDLTNFITISLVGFVGVFIINRLLDKAGKPTWKA